MARNMLAAAAVLCCMGLAPAAWTFATDVSEGADDALVQARAQVKNFMDWLRQGGAVFDGVDIEVVTPTDRRVVAAKPFRRGDSVVYIPIELMIKESDMTGDPLVGPLIRKGILQKGTENNFPIIVYLATTTSEQWRPYVDWLRTNLTVPHYWSPEEVALLQGTKAMDAFTHMDNGIVAGFKQMSKVKEIRKAGLTSEDFVHASYVVKSRQFYLNAQYGRAMIPLADASNHQTWALGNLYPQQKEDSRGSLVGLSQVATRDIEAGEELFNRYGNMSNGQLLTSYGFALDKMNEHLTLTYILMSTPMGNLKCDPMHFDANNHPAQVCLNMLRDRFPGTTLQKELAVMREIQRAAQQRLDAMGPESLSDDLQRLAEDKLMSSNARNALLVRSGEKRVAEAWRRLAQVTEEQLKQLPPFSASRAMDAMPFAMRGLDGFFESIEARLAADYRPGL